MEPLDREQLDQLNLTPTDLTYTQIYYLRYERNAWHATWIARYGVGWFDCDVSALKSRAERLRTQGTVFRITGLPALVLTTRDKIFVLTTFSKGSLPEYRSVLNAVHDGSPLGEALPPPWYDSLMLFQLPDGTFPAARYRRTTLMSRSSGGLYRLSWRNVAGQRDDFIAFKRFRRKLKAAIGQKNDHPPLIAVST